MKNRLCAVDVGIHPGPFWFDKISGLVVCFRHKNHYEESADEYGPFDWELVEYKCEWAGDFPRCNNPVRGFVDGGETGEHPLCWNHLNPDLHPENMRPNLHPLESIVSPCEHAKIKNIKTV